MSTSHTPRRRRDDAILELHDMAEALRVLAELHQRSGVLIAHVNRHRLQAVGHLRQAQRIEDHVRLAGTGGAS